MGWLNATPRQIPPALWGWLVAALIGGTAVQARTDEPAAGNVVYNRDIRPILAEYCWSCHGPDAQHRQADLRLDVREEAVRTDAIVPGQPTSSLLIERIESTDSDQRMPPVATQKTLTDTQRRLLRQWIADGAEYQRHWSLEPPVDLPPPVISGVLHPVDRFLVDRLAREGLRPSPLAEPATQVRRVSLDLTGLPPDTKTLDDFLAEYQRDPDRAYVMLVDNLLSSPHYGERWGRWWLDQARYADSNGYSIDAPRQIWPYRDWVIRALNDDMPFDQFTLQQIAGDLLPEAGPAGQIATGFHRNTQINEEGGIDPEQFRMESIFDRVATTGTVWLGLTIGCAQCHDHKFDPITQREYYQLFAFFNNQDEPSLRVSADGVDVGRLQQGLTAAQTELTRYLLTKLAELEAWRLSLSDDQRRELRGRLGAGLDESVTDRTSFQVLRQLAEAGIGREDAQFQKLHAEYESARQQFDAAPSTLVLAERGEPRQTTILIKGDFTRPAEPVTAGTPSLLPPLPTTDRTPNRVDLARWLTSPDNPLTARVLVNRIWQQYFGRGLVETENDFGTQGSYPTHPELLDWLALDFSRHGWSLKHLHRQIVTSHAYRQSSATTPELREDDPHNYLLGRQQRLRLDAEVVRDVALSASGLLSDRLGGPPVFPPIPEGVMGQGQVKHPWNVSRGENRYRRGLYTFVFRASPPPALNVFDAPDGYSSCTRRLRSNTPLQALTLLNDATCVEFAGALEQQIRNEGLATAFRRCTARWPEPDELSVLESVDPASAARILLNLDETITRE